MGTSQVYENPTTGEPITATKKCKVEQSLWKQYYDVLLRSPRLQYITSSNNYSIVVVRFQH